MLGYKVLSPNVWDLINMDYEWRGLSYILDTYRSMTTFNTNNYKLIFDREDTSSPYLNTRFLCSISLLDLYTSSPIVTLKVNELDAIRIVDNIVVYSNMNMKDLVLPIKSYNQYLLDYTIYLKRIDNDNINVRIMEYSTPHELLLDKVSFTITDELLEDMSYCMYFSWLIDIDFDGMNEFDQLVSDITIDNLSNQFYQ